jgi:CHAT domain-containing protein
VAAYSVTIASRCCCALGLLVGIVASCTDKREGNHSLSTTATESPLEPAELLRFISRIRHSDAPLALKLAEKADKAPETAGAAHWRIRLLLADLLLDQVGGSDKEVASAVSKLLNSPIPPDVPSNEAAVRIASMKGYVAQRSSDWDTAESLYDEAHAGMSDVKDDPCWKAELLVQHQAQTLRHQNRWTIAANFLREATREIDACPDKYWAALVPNLEGNSYRDQSYYENAINSFQACLTIARSNKFPQLIPVSMANMALGYFDLGDYDAALRSFDETDAYYLSLSHLTKGQRSDWGVAKGHRARTYLALKKYDDAARLYREAIQIAAETDTSDYLTRWRAELTSLYIEKDDYKSAELLNQQVLTENTLNDFPVAAAAQLNSARLARLEGDLPRAQNQLDALQRELEVHKMYSEPELLEQFHSERAQTLAGLNRAQQARHEFDAALRTADSARSSIKSDEYRLTYFLPSLNLYQNYVTFLADHYLPDDALRVAESGRARLLAEKLHETPTQRPKYDFTSIARAKNSIILSYSTAPIRSYMWVTTAHSSQMFFLPSESELTELIKRHNEPILEERALAEDQGGRDLYKLLIGPASNLIPPHGHVIVIPDGPLSNLNFETLIPPGRAPRYWLESAVVTIAPSLTLLLAKEQRAIYPTSVLAVGDAVQADPNLQPLGDQESQVIKRMYGARCKLLGQSDATPTGFLRVHPERYSLIHISAHAIPNPQSPLDSYIVLSPEANSEYKLYAHDLAKLRLSASLVTLSACQSAGAKNVPGEGLVGLTWAVLSAGAHNVVASLWPVAAPATARLMKGFYTHLNAGESPDEALHSAKVELSLALRSTPYEWAAFQLYSR